MLGKRYINLHFNSQLNSIVDGSLNCSSSNLRNNSLNNPLDKLLDKPLYKSLNKLYDTTNYTNSTNTQTNSFSILPHQQKVYNFLKKNWSIILFHKMGSGKTISSLYSALQFDKPIIIIGPKSSKKSFMDDFDKLSLFLPHINQTKSQLEFYTFQKAENLMQSNFDLLRDKIVIIDEAHHLRSQTTQMMFIINSLPLAHKLILLTGTPIINHPIDLCVLVNIAKRSEVFTIDKQLFDFYYVEKDNADTNSEPSITLKAIDDLKNKLSNCISYYEPVSSTSELGINILYPEVPLNNAQLLEYKNYIVRLINPLTKKIVHLETDINADIYNVDFVTLDIKKKNAFLTATRQLSNTIDNDPNSPKINSVVETILKGPKPVVVYSNFLANGIYPISVKLKEYNITHKMIKGTTSDEKMSSIINEYNQRIFDVLLISSAASESITLLNTRQMHILEPHFNEAKINQVIGRVIRYKSHDKLPASERNINIYHWTSVFPTLIKYKTADQYLIWLGKKKQNLIDKIINIVKTISV
jgi:superfamily II DNA or RNA helicase